MPTNLDGALAGTGGAINDLLAALEANPSVWTTRRAPGKWSPSQIVEHLARAIEESANVADGLPSKFPTFPRMIRPLFRTMFFNRILRSGVFPKARTNKALDPSVGPETPAEGRIRLESAFAGFESACRRASTAGRGIDHPLVGRIATEEFARFQGLHVRHHHAQLTDLVAIRH
jgi:hypothetical protein